MKRLAAQGIATRLLHDAIDWRLNKNFDPIQTRQLVRSGPIWYIFQGFLVGAGMNILRAGLVLLSFCAATAAEADTVTYSADLNGGAPPFNTASAAFDQTILLPQFDGTLGTLTGITLAFGTTLEALGYIQSNSLVVTYSGVTITQQNTLTAPDLTLSFSEVQGPYSGTVNQSQSTASVGSTTAGSATGSIAATSFGDYIGGGTVSLDFLASAVLTAYTTLSPGDNLSMTFAYDFGSASVTYAYDTAAGNTPTGSVPEPPTLAVFGFAAAMFALGRRFAIRRD